MAIIEKNPVFILGATSKISAETAYDLATQGYPLIVGSRGSDASRIKIDELSDRIVQGGGIAPETFYADISDPRQVDAAFNRLRLDRGRPVDFLPLAAEGFRTVRRELGEVFVRVRRSFRQKNLTEEQLIAETEAVKKIMMRPEVIEAARGTNRWGVLRVLDGLGARGNIISDVTRVETLSSNVSDYTEPGNMGLYLGPYFYPPVGIPKAELVRDLSKMALNGDFIYGDVVAPPVAKTDVGDWAQDIVEWIGFVRPIPAVPIISTRDTSTGLTQAFLRAKGNPEALQKWYVLAGGKLSATRPDWPIPLVPYL